MQSTGKLTTLFALSTALLPALPGVSTATAQVALTAEASETEIAALALQLSDPAYEKRIGATRRLCAIGQPALEMLRRISQEDDMEAALRARTVIQALERVWFAGVEVRLESDRTALAWDESVDLRIVMENKSRFPARIPFETGTGQSDGDASDARQVAAMIDASDWLVVKTAQDRDVELRVDEISDDPAVVRVIQERIKGGPSSVIAPGERATVTVAAFNRGWARYPLLEEGAYTVTLRYVPEWVDPVLAEGRVGEVRSNSLTLQVTRGAPVTVSRSGAQAEVSLRRDEGELIAVLTNRTDRAILVNTNYGVSAPFAEVEWIHHRDGQRTAISAATVVGRTWSEFDPDRFIPLAAGDTVELARVTLADLSRGLNQAGPSAVAGEGTVSFSYFNLCDRQWQLRQQSNLDQDKAVPGVFRKPLPRELLAARLNSQSLRPWSAP